MEKPDRMRPFSSSARTFFALMAVMAMGYFLLSDLMGGTIFQHQYWDSYTLQTYNWLHGRTYLEGGENYAYLELAIYQGRYYVSFPPLPSVVLIPFVALCGMNTPNNLLVGYYGLMSAALAYAIMRRRRRSPRDAAFWALVCVWGSNMLWMTTNGGVWFQAQALNMVMCLAAVLCAQHGKKAASTTFLALAVGCRPMSAIFLPVFALLFAWNERKARGGFVRSCLAQWRCVIGPILVGACYMAYNFARFGDPLEFGHNYLPEFMRAEHGQFHISYLWPNLKQLLFTPVAMENSKLSFPLFQGFMFFVANPIFILWAVRCAVNVRKSGVSAEGAGLGLGMALMLLATCTHRTLGGWQFGARYTCDMIPFAYMYLADRGRRHTASWELALGGMAVAFNAYGTVYMYLNG